jgi:hypothetical protein
MYGGQLGFVGSRTRVVGAGANTGARQGPTGLVLYFFGCAAQAQGPRSRTALPNEPLTGGVAEVEDEVLVLDTDFGVRRTAKRITHHASRITYHLRNNSIWVAASASTSEGGPPCPPHSAVSNSPDTGLARHPPRVSAHRPCEPVIIRPAPDTREPHPARLATRKTVLHSSTISYGKSGTTQNKRPPSSRPKAHRRILLELWRAWGQRPRARPTTARPTTEWGVAKSKNY